MIDGLDQSVLHGVIYQMTVFCDVFSAFSHGAAACFVNELELILVIVFVAGRIRNQAAHRSFILKNKTSTARRFGVSTTM